MTSRITTSRGGHSYALDGERVPSVTTIIGNATPKRALIGWAAREAAHWAATHVDMLSAITEQEWIDQAASAHTRSSSKLALKGTDAHRYAHQLADTGETDAPPEFVPMVEQAADFMDTWHADTIASERPCANLEWKYGGTFDWLGTLSDGKTWLLDWKTGKGPYTEQVLQLAGYASCDLYQDTDGNDQPMPENLSMGFVMLNDGGPRMWDFVPVIANREGLFSAFTHMRRINDWVEWTTPNRSGVARWPVLGEPLPRAAAS